MNGRRLPALCLMMVVGLCLCTAGGGLGATAKRGETWTVIHGVDISYV